jgi:hypothetical protein
MVYIGEAAFQGVAKGNFIESDYLSPSTRGWREIVAPSLGALGIGH